MPGQSLEDLWNRISKGDSPSLMKKHLTPERYNKYKNVMTSYGGTIGDCIRSGGWGYFNYFILFSCFI